jgi:hypothetical protein
MGLGFVEGQVHHTRQLGDDTMHTEEISFAESWSLPDATTNGLAFFRQDGQLRFLFYDSGDFKVDGDLPTGPELDLAFGTLERELALHLRQRHKFLGGQPEAGKPLVIPEEGVTLAWLWHHVPWSFWAALAGLLAASFGLGFKVAQLLAVKAA